MIWGMLWVIFIIGCIGVYLNDKTNKEEREEFLRREEKALLKRMRETNR
jgi:hypothetical protein